MNRYLFQGLSEQARASRQRFEDARVLLNASRWRCSMYIAGYAVECLLKTKLMQIYECRTLSELDDVLHQRSVLAAGNTVFIHQLEELLKLTPGYNRLRQNRQMFSLFHDVNQWTPAWRYASDRVTRTEATDFMDTIEAVMNWIDTNI